MLRSTSGSSAYVQRMSKTPSGRYLGNSHRKRRKNHLGLQNGIQKEPKSLDKIVNGGSTVLPWDLLGDRMSILGPRAPLTYPRGHQRGHEKLLGTPKKCP